MKVFTNRASQTIGALGESQLIKRIRRWLGSANPPSPFGIGDDCAVLSRSRRERVMTVDPVIYGTHFDESVRARDVGAKLLKRNISDIAAMGAKPTHAVLSLAMGAELNIFWLEQFYRGVAKEARRYGVQIVGGDIAELRSAFVATLTLIGEATTRRFLTRGGARQGDSIWVTGSLGGSILKRHYAFTPRVDEGQWLAGTNAVTSMMDVSDGLAKDLHALIPRNAQAALLRDFIPISDAARKLSQRSGRSAIEHALCDGEDYELLFTLKSGFDVARFARMWSERFKTTLTQIGQVVSNRMQMTTDYVALESFRAYEHLR